MTNKLSAAVDSWVPNDRGTDRGRTDQDLFSFGRISNLANQN